ncbi:MAG TPA: hypothetical protein ENH41_03955 [Candidatus Omnitrophica bacterium]|nr:hypothetical protein [Candidatus Omnitrophota bacterium]
MFIHAILFKINPKEVLIYRKDSKMWARYAKKVKGFIAYFTMQRLGFKNQYVSIYQWKNKASCERFMNKLHDWLVAKSKAKVGVLGYYNLKSLDAIKIKTKKH